MCQTCETASATETTPVAAPVTTVVTVTGMTCGGCAAGVTKHVRALDDVRDVAVDLATGAVTVSSDAPLDASALDDAVTAAGYAITR